MPVTIILPAVLRRFAGDVAETAVRGSTVSEALTTLTATHPALRHHLFDEADSLRNHVGIYVNEENIRYLDGESTALQDGDTISIVPSVAGGHEATTEKSGGLTNEEIERYSRHLIMPEVGPSGQAKLKKASVLCVGTGGLGSPLALYLAAAGVGRLGLVDFDVVDTTNLHRQIIHGSSDVGRSKMASAVDSLREINPHVQLDAHETKLTSANAMEIIAPYDLVVDGTDNFPTRYLVNDACVLLGKPNVYGSIFRFEGQASVFWAEKGPCYRCLYQEPPPPGMVPSCAEGGVLGILPGLIGIVQATEAVKLIIGQGTPLIGRLMLYDALAMKFREMKLRKDPQCPVCGAHPTVTELIDYEQFCGLGATPEQVPLGPEHETTPEEVKARLDRNDNFLLLDVREPHEFDICHIGETTLIPLGELPLRFHELDRGSDIVVYCRSGERSAKAVVFLKEAGYKHIKNMSGGTLAWADSVDPSMPRY